MASSVSNSLIVLAACLQKNWLLCTVLAARAQNLLATGGQSHTYYTRVAAAGRMQIVVIASCKLVTEIRSDSLNNLKELSHEIESGHA
jgi:hypothetical protein